MRRLAPAEGRRTFILLVLALLAGAAVLLLSPAEGQATTLSPPPTTLVNPPYSVTESIEPIGHAYGFDCQWGDVIEVRVTPLGESQVYVSLVGLPFGDAGGNSLGTSREPAYITHKVEQSGRWQVVVAPAPGCEIPVSYSISLWFSSKGSTTPTTAYHPTFSDVPASHPCVNQINDLAFRGILSGYPDGSFRPNASLTRQQLAKLIVKTLGYPVSEHDVCPFTDVQTGGYPDPLYPDNYVAVCAARLITVGKTPTSFAPDDVTTREQLITMLARAADLPAAPDSYVPRFGPRGLFSTEEHRANGVKAYYAGLMDRLYPGTHYRFTQAASRSEACLMLHNLLLRTGDLTPTPTTQPQPADPDCQGSFD